MGFWENKKFATETKADLNWQHLNELEQLELIHQKSFTRPQVIFKHSIHCGTSAMAKYQLEESWDLHQTIDFYYLDLINHRQISNAISTKYQTTHQSPQLLVINQGVVTNHVSHHRVSMDWLKQTLSEVG